MERDLSLPDKSRIAHEILAYLMEHPDAQDTLEGVMEWWLLERNLKYEARKVNELLAELVVEGLILEKKNSNLKIRYKINPEKKSEIQSLLDQGKSPR